MKGVWEGSYVGVGGVPAVEGGRAKAVRRRGECEGGMKGPKTERAASHMAMAALVGVPACGCPGGHLESIPVVRCDAGWLSRPVPAGGGFLSAPIPGQGLPRSFQPFFLPNESFSVVTRLNTGLSAEWSKRSAT